MSTINHTKQLSPSTRSGRQRGKKNRFSTAVIALGILLSSYLILSAAPKGYWQSWLGAEPSTAASHPVDASVAMSKVSATPLPKGQAIETLRPGDRVLARMPDGSISDESFDTEVVPANWRLVSMLHESREANGMINDVHVQSLMPQRWLESQNAMVGSYIDMPIDLEEMGIKGQGLIQQIEPCPPIKQGSGRVVLNTINSRSSKVCELIVESVQSGQKETIYPTANHRLFSDTQQDWIETSQLSPGEYLTTHAGKVRVVSLRQIEGTHRVYNLTVEKDHVYYVSTLGVLGHNQNCSDIVQKIIDPSRLLEVGKNVADHHIIPAFRGNSKPYADFIKKRGIDVDQFTVTLAHGKASHHLKFIHSQGKWNQKWIDWIEANPDATAKDIYQFAGKIMDEFNLSGLRIHPYGAY